MVSGQNKGVCTDDMIILGESSKPPSNVPCQHFQGNKRSEQKGDCENGMLCSKKFEHYFEMIWNEIPKEKRNSFAYMDSLFFNLYIHSNDKQNVLKWIKNSDILSKKYTLVPIVLWGHWFLLILCNFGEESSSPCMLLLDSMTSANLHIEPQIRKFLKDMLSIVGRTMSEEQIYEFPLLIPKVPQQHGDVECGWYVLLYAKLFIENAPENFSISKGYPYFMIEDWFDIETFDEFCKGLCESVHGDLGEKVVDLDIENELSLVACDVLEKQKEKELIPDLNKEVQIDLFEDLIPVLTQEVQTGELVHAKTHLTKDKFQQTIDIVETQSAMAEVCYLEDEEFDRFYEEEFGTEGNTIATKSNSDMIGIDNITNEAAIEKGDLDDSSSDDGDYFEDSDFDMSEDDELIGVTIDKHIQQFEADLSNSLIEGNYTDQYRLLWNYCEELHKRNPGSTIRMDSRGNDENGDEYFHRIYICLEALRLGFEAGCRKVIGLNSTFLKGPHKHVLLTAVGIDANNGIFPIVYAVVDSDNKSNWSWFIRCLNDDLGIKKKQGSWTFISYMQKGLLQAMFEILPHCEHRYCVRHLHNNLKKVCSNDAIKEHMWKCAKATDMRKFEFELEKLKECDKSAYQWLQNHTSVVHWSRSHFREETKCDVLLNNHNEIFNKNILLARGKPILQLLEGIMSYIIVRHRSKRRLISRQTSKICPRIMKRIEKLKHDSVFCYLSYVGGSQFQIHTTNSEQFVVDTKKRSCTCRKWNLSGIPCVHGLAVLRFLGENPEDYVDSCYAIATYKRAYEPIINPTNAPASWLKSNMNPLNAPPKIRMPERPAKKMRLEPDESTLKLKENGVQKLSMLGLSNFRCKNCGQIDRNSKIHTKEQFASEQLTQSKVGRTTSKQKINKCGKCGESGHNRRTCSKPTIESSQTEPQAYLGLETMQQVHQVQSGPYELDLAQHGANEGDGISCDQPSQSQLTQTNEIQLDIPQDTVIVMPPTQDNDQKVRKPVRCGLCGEVGHNRVTCTK